MGLVYKAGKNIKPVPIGWILVGLKFFVGMLLKTGLVMMILGVLGIGWVYQPLVFAQIKYRWSQTELAKLGRGEVPGSMISDTFTVNVPKIGAVSRVIPDVNAGNYQEYMLALKEGVAQASGLANPGEIGTTYLFAHSVSSRVDFARYNAVFYLLDQLVIGDEVEITYESRLYKYQITNREILAATDTKYLKPQNTEEKLVLQTCYPPGTSWKRLVVIAKRI